MRHLGMTHLAGLHGTLQCLAVLLVASLRRPERSRSSPLSVWAVSGRWSSGLQNLCDHPSPRALRVQGWSFMFVACQAQRCCCKAQWPQGVLRHQRPCHVVSSPRRPLAPRNSRGTAFFEVALPLHLASRQMFAYLVVLVLENCPYFRKW